MSSRIIIRVTYIALIVLVVSYFYKRDEAATIPLPAKIDANPVSKGTTPQNESASPSLYDIEKSKVVLDVAYASEAPEGKWVEPWVNACEEATILMVDMYYKGAKSVSIPEAKNYLQFLFDREDEMFGTNKNADSSQIMALITRHADFRGRVVDNPSLEDLKNEIRAGRPIISLHRGFDLKNPNIKFSPIKSSYHTIVIVGFDDDRQMFIAHDPGDEREGEYYEYSYDTIMNSMHDYDSERDKADGVPRAIFTSLKRV